MSLRGQTFRQDELLAVSEASKTKLLLSFSRLREGGGKRKSPAVVSGPPTIGSQARRHPCRHKRLPIEPSNGAEPRDDAGWTTIACPPCAPKRRISRYTLAIKRHNISYDDMRYVRSTCRRWERTDCKHSHGWEILA